MGVKCRKKAEAKQRYDCEKFQITLSLGVPHPSDELLKQLRPVWQHCGPSIIAEWMEGREDPGHRPWGWWQFDAPNKRDFESQPNQWDALRDWGVLEPWEIAAVNAQWRRWFGCDYYESEEACLLQLKK